MTKDPRIADDNTSAINMGAKLKFCSVEILCFLSAEKCFDEF